jgi:2,4-dienoyl-CoA reductase-like NADH-dependent reductase (Old Yellow Enzyme family)
MGQNHLFSPIELRSLALPNRVAVSPMCQYEAEDGSATDWHLAHLGQLAMGGAGLLILEATAVSRVGRITHRCLGIYSDANEKALRRVTEFCRHYGVAKLGIQLAHAGRKGSTHVPRQGGAPLKPGEDPWLTEAPSAVPYADWHVPAALDGEGLARVQRSFVQAVERADRIGLDLIELHAGHGYLLHQFLSPLSNRRSDDYGGTSEKRMRFPLEVFAACRAAWPAHKPMGIRLSATDWVEGGWTPEETVVLAKRLKTLGCDYIDVTSAGLDPRQKIPLGPGYQVHFAEQVKREAQIPTMAVCMITEAHQAESIIASGQADMVALARSMLLDPRWAWHAAQELGAEAALPPNYFRAHPRNWPQAFPHKKAAE